MPAAKPALSVEPKRKAEPKSSTVQAVSEAASQGPRRLPTTVTDTEQAKPRTAVSPPARPHNGYSFQARVPVITGEATFRGLIPMDGVICGQLGANPSALTIRQRPRSSSLETGPEQRASGELAPAGCLFTRERLDSGRDRKSVV